jgi:penicillin-binding protein 2
MSIGQGFMLATPIQVLNAYAAIANGGTRYKPHMVKEIRNIQNEVIYQAQPEVASELNLKPETLSYIQAGLAGVVDYGTASTIIDVPGVAVSGKTGTAEFCKRYPQCLDQDGRVQDKHAWFVDYAPRENPQIAVIVFVYDGGEGSEVAAPVANNILRYYFGIDRPADEEDLPTNVVEVPVEAVFEARLLGTDFLSSAEAGVHGFVLDPDGNGLGEIAVELVLDDQIIAQTMTGQNGQFDFNQIDTRQTGDWQIRLGNYPNSPAIRLEVTAGTRYFIEFQMTKVAENLITEDGSG